MWRPYRQRAEMTEKRRPVIAGNWKMNTDVESSEFLARKIVKLLKESVPEGIDVIIAPPFPYLERVSRVIEGSPVKLGAQNASWADLGAFTGEVSPPMLLEWGLKWCIVGHSERRSLLGESDELINRKLRACLKAGLTPILCIGESASARKGNRAESVVERQLSGALKDLDPESLGQLIVAYEPVWAIGTGENATPEQAQDMHAFIRSTLADLVDPVAASKLRIQYGGSVNHENIASLMTGNDVDGALVGGASLEAESFISIVRYSSN